MSYHARLNKVIARIYWICIFSEFFFSNLMLTGGKLFK